MQRSTNQLIGGSVWVADRAEVELVWQHHALGKGVCVRFVTYCYLRERNCTSGINDCGFKRRSDSSALAGSAADGVFRCSCHYWLGDLLRIGRFIAG